MLYLVGSFKKVSIFEGEGGHQKDGKYNSLKPSLSAPLLQMAKFDIRQGDPSPFITGKFQRYF